MSQNSIEEPIDEELQVSVRRPRVYKPRQEYLNAGDFRERFQCRGSLKVFSLKLDHLLWHDLKLRQQWLRNINWWLLFDFMHLILFNITQLFDLNRESNDPYIDVSSDEDGEDQEI